VGDGWLVGWLLRHFVGGLVHWRGMACAIAMIWQPTTQPINRAINPTTNKPGNHTHGYAMVDILIDWWVGVLAGSHSDLGLHSWCC